MGKIRLLLVDDHALSRESLGRLLAAEPDFEMAGQCGAANEALGILKNSLVDVVLLDFNLGKDHGNEFIRSSRQQGFTGTILIVTDRIEAGELIPAMQAGASGIFLKSNSPEVLAKAIRMAAGGDAWMDPRVIELMTNEIRRLHPGHTPKQLTHREKQVLQGVFEGLSNRRIATHLGVSEGTVKAAVQQLFQKTQVRTRSQLVRAAIEQSLLAVTPKSSHV